ncbi:MAG: hypothetical protein Tsb0014_17460 [Pleurocapsa sp.]
MQHITYQTTLGELVPLVETTDYTNAELVEDLLQNGVTSPVILIANGAKSRFGMKKISVKDGNKRLNLAAKNKKIAKLKVQVVLLDHSSETMEVAASTQTFSSRSSVEQFPESNIYRWKNEKRELLECCTPKELAQKYGIRMQYLNTVIQGKVKSTKGWSLA